MHVDEASRNIKQSWSTCTKHGSNICSGWIGPHHLLLLDSWYYQIVTLCNSAHHGPQLRRQCCHQARVEYELLHKAFRIREEHGKSRLASKRSSLLTLISTSIVKDAFGCRLLAKTLRSKTFCGALPPRVEFFYRHVLLPGRSHGFELHGKGLCTANIWLQFLQIPLKGSSPLSKGVEPQQQQLPSTTSCSPHSHGST